MIDIYSVNDFFCGAGGMGMGFKNAGFSLSGAWDYDKHALKSYKYNIDTKAKYKDISKMNYSDIPYADVWTFGFPCQDISSLGKRKGMIEGETRSGLFYEVMRLLKETKENNPKNLPKIILAENVKAIKPHLSKVELSYNSVGYKMSSVLYNSKDFGVPQSRERFFILGTSNSFESAMNLPTKPTPIQSKFEDFIESSVDEKYYVENSQILERALKTRGENKSSIVIYDGYNSLFKKDETIGTLTRNCGYGGRNGWLILGKKTQDRLRKLTPKEAARLQGFSDSWEVVVSDSQMFKQMGNAVTVSVSNFIAKEIIKFLHNNKKNNTLIKEVF